MTMAEDYNCEVHIFDASVDSNNETAGISYHDWDLGSFFIVGC